MHLEELQATNAKCAKNSTLLWKYHTERFPQWIKEKVISILIVFVLKFMFTFIIKCYFFPVFLC